MRSNVYLMLAFLAGIAVVAIAVFMLMIAAAHTVRPSDFPVYAYRDYIDRSEDMTFTADGGAQLYEAEKAELSDAEIADNALASGGRVASVAEGASLRFDITSDSVVSARLFLSAGYISESGASVAAGELFSLRCNGAEVGVRTATVRGCGSLFDFRENELCTVELKAGANEIEISALSDDFSADYMTLVSPKERTSSDPVKGVPSQPFASDGGAQRYEAERAENGGAVAYSAASASEGYYMRLFAEGSSVAFYPDSDGSATAELSVALRCPGSSARISDLCVLYVNGMETRLYDAGTGASYGFTVMHIADISLGAGVNEVRLVRRSGVFDIDYAILEYLDIPEAGGDVMIDPDRGAP